MKMENNEILSKLEKYSPWIKINRKLEGPVLITSLVYILVYLAITLYLWKVEFQMTDIHRITYFIGFGLCIIAIYLAFTGFLLRRIK
jgi:hypothetical protein